MLYFTTISIFPTFRLGSFRSSKQSAWGKENTMNYTARVFKTLKKPAAFLPSGKAATDGCGLY